MLLLDLAAKVAMSEQGSMMPLEAMGGAIIPAVGTSVLFTAEDDEDEIHRRCDQIVLGKPDPNRLIILPMPNIGGPRPLITIGREGPEFTSEYHNIREELLDINNLRLVVFDPLQNFAGGDVNSDPAAGSMFFSGLARIAAETGATTLVTHHFRKTGSNPITNARGAREAIRGTSALVDGGRWSYAIWEAERSEAEKICKQINRHFQPEIIFNGAVVKSNWPTDKTVRTYVRDPNSGLLIDRTLDLQGIEKNQDNLLDSLTYQVSKAAANGQPFTRTGGNGLYERRSEFPSALASLPKRRLWELADTLLESNKLVQCVAPGSQMKKWLDIPTGDFAQGIGQFQIGSGPEMEHSK